MLYNKTHDMTPFIFSILLPILSSLVAVVVAAECPMPDYLGSISHNLPGYLDILPNGRGGSDLFITSFSGQPLSKGSVSRIESINDLLLNHSNISSIQLNTSFVVDSCTKWPNGIKPLPENVYVEGTDSTHQRLIGCGGFLVPTHGNGACIVYDIDEEGNVKELVLTRAGFQNFFHQAVFYDVDGDGFQDLITAKAIKQMISGSDSPYCGGLYWYKNPGDITSQSSSRFLRASSSSSTTPWEEHLMFAGPDVHFELRDFNNDTIPEIIATQFFSEQLTVNWLKDGCTFDGGPSCWEHRTVVDDLSFLFNLTLVDVNGDGKDDILFTNHVADTALAGVYAVEIPTNFKVDEFQLHTLQNNFPTLNEGPGQGSPGGAVPIHHPTIDHLYVISGDGNQRAHIMCPDDNSTRTEDDGWSFQRQLLLDTGNTVGQIAVGDITGDGFPEIFVPSFEKGEIHIYSYGI